MQSVCYISMPVCSGELSTWVGMSRVCEGVNDQALCVNRVRESVRRVRESKRMSGVWCEQTTITAAWFSLQIAGVLVQQLYILNIYSIN